MVNLRKRTRNLISKIVSLSIITILFVTLCHPVLAEAASIKLNKTKLTMYFGDTYTLKLNGASDKINWSSSNTKVAVVSPQGKITTLSNGASTITAEHNNKKYSCKLTVKDNKLNTTKITLNVNDTYKLILNGTKAKKTWSSNKDNVASVSSYGTIKARTVGTTTITARVANKTYKCIVTVEKPEINETELSLYRDNYSVLSVKGTKSIPEWKSLNTNIVTVDKQGKVTAVKPGSTIVTATVNKKDINCKITVKETEILCDSPKLLAGCSTNIKLSNNASNIQWSSDNNNVVTVNQDGILQAIAAGTAHITAKYDGTDYTTNIIVEAPYLSSTFLSIRKGETSTLSISGTTQEVSWTSQNKNVATITPEGSIKGISTGTTTIIALIGNKEFSCTVEITKSTSELISDENIRHTNALAQIKNDSYTIKQKCYNQIKELQRQTTPYYGSYSDYSAEVSELTNSISVMQRQINALSLSTDRADIAKRLQIESKQKSKQDELNRLNARHSVTVQIEALYDEADNYEVNAIASENALHESNLAMIRG